MEHPIKMSHIFNNLLKKPRNQEIWGSWGNNLNIFCIFDLFVFFLGETLNSTNKETK